MSVQVQVYKCPTRGCNNNSYKNLPPTSQSRLRFCIPCLKRSGMGVMLTWLCVKCGKPITQGKISLHYCRDCAKQSRRDYHRRYWQKVRHLRLKKRNCIWCSGVFKNVRRRRYCSDYCKWMNWVKNKNLHNYRKIEVLI